MNLGIIKRRVRILRASTTATRWNEQWLMDLANQAQVQVSLDVDYPEASQVITTLVSPPSPVLTLVTGPMPSPTTIVIPGRLLLVPADASSTVAVTLATPLVAVHAILCSVVHPTDPGEPYPSLDASAINPVLAGDGTLTFNVVVTGGDTGSTVTVDYSVEGN